MFKGKFALKNK